jgi:hypothetical protein
VEGENLMPAKRMLIVPAELVRKIDENRGDMSHTDFIEFLIDSQIEHWDKTQQETKWVTREELRLFEEDVRLFLKRLLNCFTTYCLRVIKDLQKTKKVSPKTELKKLTAELHDLEAYL